MTVRPANGPEGPAISSLAALGRAENACRRCPLYRGATQAVPGQGLARAPIMLVGEQPGDKEDVAGKPFVGPAGGVLERALEDAGMERKAVFVTNAVKHFKFAMRGKRRLHKRPNAYEIERCQWWLDLERKLVKPALIVVLGASAARSLFGRPVTIAKTRGRTHRLSDGTAVLVTVHPSSLLRIRESDDRRREFRAFVADLRQAAAFVTRRVA